MANLVNAESVDKAYGEKVLLDGVSLGIEQRDRIGVVGLNGGGKTTLLEILTGIEPPDAGRVSPARDLRLAVVTQRTELDESGTVRDVVLAGYGAEYEWAAHPRIRSVVDGLAITSIGLDSAVRGLSGGERRRVALAVALVRELDLVVLDEPTNHLDVQGVRWLADHLLARKLALIVVTHDRWFLDTVCTRTWEVVRGSVEQYEGGYADWVYARAERARLAATAEDRRRNLARKELAWLQRGARARTSKPKYRVEAAEALISTVPPPRDTVELHTFAKRRLGRTVIELEDASLRLGERAMLDGATWRLGPGDRIGLVGVNGSGKTTLLRLLAGVRAPDTGKRIVGKTVRLGYLTQELEDLPGDPRLVQSPLRQAGATPAQRSSGRQTSGGGPRMPERPPQVPTHPPSRPQPTGRVDQSWHRTLRVLEAVEDVARRVVIGKHEMSASQLAERMGFPAQRQWTPVDDLSGGERRRLQLTRLLMAEPNVLLLDEPTNDLDIDTLQQLEDLLDGWPGTLVVVSHDRYLVERVCDTVVAMFGDGRITHLPGGIDEYLARRVEPAERGVRPESPAERAVRPARSDAAEQRRARKELARLERRLDTLHERERQLHHALADAVASDAEQLLQLDTALKAVLAEIDDVESEWMGIADTAE